MDKAEDEGADEAQHDSDAIEDDSSEVQWCHVGLQLPDEDAERLGPDVSWVWCHHRLRNRFTPTKRP